MHKKLISIALLLVLGGAICGTDIAVAQENVAVPTGEQRLPPLPPIGDEALAPRVPPPPDGRMMTPPLPPMQQDGRQLPPIPPKDFNQGRTPSSNGSDLRQPTDSRGQQNPDVRMMPPQGRDTGQFNAKQQPWSSGEGIMGDNEGDSEEREQMMQKEQLTRLKQNMRGMEQGLTQTKKTIDRLTKKGVAVPAEYTSVVTELSQALATIKSATEYTDEVATASDTIMEKSEDLRDIGPKLGMLEQLPKMLTRAEKQIKKMTDGVAKAKKRKDAEQYSAVIAKVESAIAGVRSIYAGIKQQNDAGNIEEAMDALMQDLPDSMQEAQRELSVLEHMSNMAKLVKSTEKEIATFEKQVRSLGKKGKDVSKITAIITEARAKLAELKALGTNASADPEDFFDIMQALDGLRQDAMDTFNELNGKKGSMEGTVIRAFRELREGR